jgi:hypothetical protein
MELEVVPVAPRRRTMRRLGGAAYAVLGAALALALTADDSALAADPARSGRQRPVTASQRVAAAPAAVVSVEGSAGTLTLDWGDLDASPLVWKGNYVVMQPWEYARIPALKAKNPGLQVLMYKDVSATVAGACRDAACTRDDAILPTGVGYHWALRHHPRWFLRDRDGHQLEWSDWRGLYPMDVSRPDYQQRWADNVLTELGAHDWDGVMLDDVLTGLSHSVVDARVSTAIPTDAAMYDATESFLAAVGPRLTGAGFAAITNVAFQWDDWRSVLADWSPYVTGWENEYFVKWGLDDSERPFTGDDWAWKMRMADWCAQRDVPLLAVTYSTRTDTAVQVYHRATWLLTWNGRTGSSIFVPAEELTDHWLPVATADIGLPTGPRRRDAGSGVYRRDYTRGAVLVNPSTTTTRVPLDRSYTTRSGRSVTSVRLGPASAVILRR